jgi:CPA1 family monovalent cation:H+ antiporter
MVIGWTGMRGIVTLAAALALPLTFPFRAEIILISFTVILVTLVLQGLSLTPMIRVLRMEDDETFEREEMLARERAAEAALRRLDELSDAPWPPADHLGRLRDQYRRRRQRFSPDAPVAPECAVETTEAVRRLRHETIHAERAALIALRNDGTISDEVLHRLERELDVEALRSGIGERRAPSRP